jgi:hypothetical protein
MTFETVDKYIKKIFNPITGDRGSRKLKEATENYS